MLEVSEILEQIPIEEYIKQYIDGEYEEKGGELWCISPFNPEERTPSFSIRTEDQIFYCFSTHIGGNLLDFVKRYHKVGITKAINMLKQYANITDDGEQDGPVTKLTATRICKRFRKIKKHANPASLKTLPENFLDRYELNIAKLSSWADEGIEWDVMKRFCVKYDRFDDRIVYPVRNYAGEIVSICGRTCDPNFKEKRLRKYTYYQSIQGIDTLYGFSDNQDEIFNRKEMIIFEGAKSVMKAYGWGYRNGVAALTSHLNDNQLRFLIQMGNLYGIRIVFAFDSDVDIRKDENIMKLARYAKVEWVQNRYNLLQPKDSPVDRGREVFEKLYAERSKL